MASWLFRLCGDGVLVFSLSLCLGAVVSTFDDDDDLYVAQ